MVTLLCIIIAISGVALCLVVAEPWQRPRYERVVEDGRAKLADLEALIAAEMNREARDG